MYSELYYSIYTAHSWTVTLSTSNTHFPLYHGLFVVETPHGRIAGYPSLALQSSKPIKNIVMEPTPPLIRFKSHVIGCAVELAGQLAQINELYLKLDNAPVLRRGRHNFFLM